MAAIVVIMSQPSVRVKLVSIHMNRAISSRISCHITFFSCHISWKTELIVLACLYIEKSLELVELWHARTPSSESRGVPHQSQPNGRFAGFQENQAPGFQKPSEVSNSPGRARLTGGLRARNSQRPQTRTWRRTGHHPAVGNRRWCPLAAWACAVPLWRAFARS